MIVNLQCIEAMSIHQIFSFLLLIFGTTGFSQSRTISGKIISDDLYPWPEAFIYFKDTILLGKSNDIGEFKLNIRDSSNLAIKIKVVGVGAEEKLVTIPAECSYLELIFLNAGTYDYKSHRKVDRERLKYFKTIPMIRRKAVQNGIFKAEKPCYTEEFIFIKPKLDEIRRNRKQKTRANIFAESLGSFGSGV
jgi:hypothetical protein